MAGLPPSLIFPPLLLPVFASGLPPLIPAAVWILRQHQHHTPRSCLRRQIPPRWTHRTSSATSSLILLPLPTMQQQNQCIHCKWKEHNEIVVLSNNELNMNTITYLSHLIRDSFAVSITSEPTVTQRHLTRPPLSILIRRKQRSHESGALMMLLPLSSPFTAPGGGRPLPNHRAADRWPLRRHNKSPLVPCCYASWCGSSKSGSRREDKLLLF